jgi:tetratricopeptide (TPR) repeat protein
LSASGNGPKHFRHASLADALEKNVPSIALGFVLILDGFGHNLDTLTDFPHSREVANWVHLTTSGLNKRLFRRRNYPPATRLRKLHTVKTRGINACLIVVLVAWAGLAAAETPAQRTAAKKAFVQGDDAFKQGRYEEALAAFKSGFELSEKPRFLLNIAHCQRKLGRFGESLENYQRFLETDPKPADRDLALKMVAEVTPLAAQEKAEREQHDRAAQLSVNPTAPAATAVPLTDVAAHPAEAAGPLYSRWYFWAGVGVVLVAGVFTVLALSDGDAASQTGSWGEVRL